jgi:hypothetical protein
VVRDVASDVKSAIREYRSHHRLDEVGGLAQQKVRFLFQCFGYAAGRLVANGANLEDVAPESLAALETAGLKAVWHAVVEELQRLDGCRDSWTTFDELNTLMDLVIQTYAALGMNFRIKEGNVWVDIPFTADTLS